MMQYPGLRRGPQRRTEHRSRPDSAGTSARRAWSASLVAKRQIEARLYWGRDLEAVTYTPLRSELAVADLGLPSSGDAMVTNDRGELALEIVELENEQTIHLAIV